ncbi:MAG TPA: hypothetical protein PLQ11_08065 [Beijerinckiaceae bacterium]|nr:hypothetical protein [Beijerinckiaceae bacterium]
MTGPLAGLGPADFMCAGPDATPPQPANDNEPGVPAAGGFRGLLLRQADAGYEILLCHSEPGLSQRVETVADDTEVIALWRSIGRKLNLVLFAETADGEIVQIDPMPSLTALPRRFGNPVVSRRPRFARRRKMGNAAAASVTTGVQIAR